MILNETFDLWYYYNAQKIKEIQKINKKAVDGFDSLFSYIVARKKVRSSLK